MNSDNAEHIEFFQDGCILHKENTAPTKADEQRWKRMERLADNALDVVTVALAAATCLLPVAFLVGIIAAMLK